MTGKRPAAFGSGAFRFASLVQAPPPAQYSYPPDAAAGHRIRADYDSRTDHPPRITELPAGLATIPASHRFLHHTVPAARQAHPLPDHRPQRNTMHRAPDAPRKPLLSTGIATIRTLPHPPATVADLSSRSQQHSHPDHIPTRNSLLDDRLRVVESEEKIGRAHV